MKTIINRGVPASKRLIKRTKKPEEIIPENITVEIETATGKSKVI